MKVKYPFRLKKSVSSDCSKEENDQQKRSAQRRFTLPARSKRHENVDQFKFDRKCIVHDGLLKKSPPLEQYLSSWKERYFILYDTEQLYLRRSEGVPSTFEKVLMYYKKKNDKECINKIPLKGATVCENLTKVNGHEHVIELQTTERKYYLCAKNKIDHDEWLEKLKETIASSQDVRRDSLVIDNEVKDDSHMINDGRLQAELESLKKQREDQHQQQREITSQSEMKHLDHFLPSDSSRTDSGISTDQDDTVFQTCIDKQQPSNKWLTSGYQNVNKQTGEFHYNQVPSNKTSLVENKDDFYNIDEYYPNPSTNGYSSPPPVPISLDDNVGHDYQHPSAVHRRKPEESEELYDVPPTTKNTDDIYDVPPNTAGGSEEIYDVPPDANPSLTQEDIYNVPNSINNINEIYDTPLTTHDTSLTTHDTQAPVTEEIYDTPPSKNQSDVEGNETYDIPPSAYPSVDYVNISRDQYGRNTALDASSAPPRPFKPDELKANTKIETKTNTSSPKPSENEHYKINRVVDSHLSFEQEGYDEPTTDSNQMEEIYDSPPINRTFKPLTLNDNNNNNTMMEDAIYDTPPVERNNKFLPKQPLSIEEIATIKKHYSVNDPSSIYSNTPLPPTPEARAHTLPRQQTAQPQQEQLQAPVIPQRVGSFPKTKHNKHTFSKRPTYFDTTFDDNIATDSEGYLKRDVKSPRESSAEDYEAMFSAKAIENYDFPPSANTNISRQQEDYEVLTSPKTVENYDFSLSPTNTNTSFRRITAASYYGNNKSRFKREARE